MIWKTSWGTQAMNVLELKTEVIVLLPASYEKEWLEKHCAENLTQVRGW